MESIVAKRTSELDQAVIDLGEANDKLQNLDNLKNDFILQIKRLH